MSQDVKLLSQDTHALRLYSTANGFEKVVSDAIADGMHVIPGAFISSSSDQNTTEIKALTQTITDFKGSTSIPFVVVGNEATSTNGATVNQLTSAIDQVNNVNGGFKIATADTWDFWLNNANAATVAAKVDVILVIIHPFNDMVPIDQAVNYTTQQFQKVQAAYPTKTVLIGETGWPSQGTNGPAVGSTANEETYAAGILKETARLGIGILYFEAFDEAWKITATGKTSEGNFGLFTSSRDSNAAHPKGVVQDTFTPSSQYSFAEPNATVNLVRTFDGSNPPPPVAGSFNIELVTSPTGSTFDIPQGYQGIAALTSSTGKALQLFGGSFQVADTGAGNSIVAGSGNQTVIGAKGDTITGSTASGSTLLVDASGANALVVAGAMTITGGAGPTTVWAGASDSIAGGAGLLLAAGNKANNMTIASGAGNLNAFNFGTGNSVTGSTAGTTFIDDNYGGSGNTIGGGAGSTTVISGKSDVIKGGAGAMLVNALSGPSTITGGSGPTTIWGAANQSVTGGAGALQVAGNVAAGETIIGGTGSLFAFNLGKNDSVVGSSSGPTFIDDTYGSGGGSSIVGGSGGGALAGGENTEILAASTDKVTVAGALTYVNAAAGSITVQGGNSTVTGTVEGAVGVNTNILGGKSDAITLGAAAALIDAKAGPMTITGGAGAVTVEAGKSDMIIGGGGALTVNDTAFAGSLSVTGGAGNLFAFSLGKSNTISGSTTGWTVVNDSYKNGSVAGGGGSSITGGSGTATVPSAFGGVAANTFVIGAAGDTITGGTGTMFVNARAGSELITGGTSPTSTVTGLTGATTVEGGNLDTITGNTGTLLIDITAKSSGAQTVNLSAGHGVATLRDINPGATTTGATDKASVTEFATATDIIASKTSVSSTNTFLGSSSSSGGSTTLTFVDGSTMTLVGVATITAIKFTQ